MILTLLTLGHFLSRALTGAAHLYRDRIVADMEVSLRTETGWTEADATGSSGPQRFTPTFSATRRVRDAFATAGLVRSRPDIHTRYRRAQALLNFSVLFAVLLCVAVAVYAALAPYARGIAPEGTYGEHRWQQVLTIGGALDRAIVTDIPLWALAALAMPLLPWLASLAEGAQKAARHVHPALAAVRELLGFEDIPGVFRRAWAARILAYAWRVLVAARLAMLTYFALRQV